MSTATLEQIEVIDSKQMRVLTEFEIPQDEVVEGSRVIRIGELNGNIIIATSKRSADILFERANLPRVIEVMERVFESNADYEMSGNPSFSFKSGKDHFIAAVGYITRIEAGIYLRNYRATMLDGLSGEVGFSPMFHPATARRLLEELKRLG